MNYKFNPASEVYSGCIPKTQDDQGYGFITGDEGVRFFCSITKKQCKGEAGNALLCQMCGGTGDTNQFVNKSMGFEQTFNFYLSFRSTRKFLKESNNLRGNDGLLDKFLFISTKPVFNKSLAKRK